MGEIKAVSITSGAQRFSLEFLDHYYFWGNNSDWDTGVAYVVGTWTHVCFTSDGSDSTPNLKLFINGSEVAAGTPGSILTTAGTWCGFGSHHAAGGSPDALFDNGVIHDRQLSVSEVFQLYEEQVKGSRSLLNIRSRTSWYLNTEAAPGGAVVPIGVFASRTQPMGMGVMANF